MSFSTYTPLAVYPGDGVQTLFDVPDLFYDISDVRLVLVIDGEEIPQVLGADYTVQVIGREDKPPYRQMGRVLLTVPPLVATNVVPFILPAPNQDQPFEGRAVTPRQHERVHDRQSQLSAMLFEFFNRSYRSPLDTPPALRTIVAGRTGYVPTWDANGNLIEGPTVQDVNIVAGFIGQVVVAAGIQAQIVTVAGIAAQVVTVSSIAGDVAALGPQAAAIGALAPYTAQMATLAPRAADIAALGPLSTQIAALGAITTDIVAINAANINTVAASIGSVVTVASNMGAVVTVAMSIDDVEVVAANIVAVDNVSMNMAALLAVPGQAAGSASAAAASAVLAQRWAVEVEDTPVTGGQFSSYHWARKAELQAVTVAATKIGAFVKADPRAVAFTKTGVGTVSLKAGSYIEVGGTIYPFAVATAITMPALTAGTDYAIWINPLGTLEATTDHVSPPVAGGRKIGGFHYAPGGNAAAMAGGNTTAQVNEFSLWDLNFRPACPDPRGMALVANSFWVDIYLLGVNHHVDGSSRYNVTIADGSSPPKVPTAFGGNGSTTYGTLNWWEAAEVMQSHGKDLLDVAEFSAMAYGTTEATSGGTNPVSTILRAAYTSKWGVMLATGNLYVWGRDFGGYYGTLAWTANGRGSTYMLSNAALLGGSWGGAAFSGSRAANWSVLPSYSDVSVGARGRCDHLCHV